MEHSIEILVDDRLGELRDRSAAELRLLPPSSTDVVHLDGKDIKLTVYHDNLENDFHRIVVQGVRERWGGITAKVVAQGFVITTDGVKRTLEAAELYDFT